VKCFCEVAEALEEPDARLPRLRIPSCRRCRDVIAVDVGWRQVKRRGDRRSRTWYRDLHSVERVTVPA
jgi:hypothetical protein